MCSLFKTILGACGLISPKMCFVLEKSNHTNCKIKTKKKQIFWKKNKENKIKIYKILELLLSILLIQCIDCLLSFLKQ